jgi:FG-GAP repeat
MASRPAFTRRRLRRATTRLVLETLEDRLVPTLFPAVLPLGSLNGANGFAVSGIAQEDRSGLSVAKAGDVNGDGIGDMIIGAPQFKMLGTPARGQSYVVFGTNDGFPRR